MSIKKVYRSHFVSAQIEFFKGYDIDVVEWFRIDENPADYFPNRSVDNGRLLFMGQIEVFHDCLQRAKHNYEYMLFTDMDELVIPTNYYRLVDWLASVHQNEMNHSDYSSIALDAHEHYMSRYGNDSWSPNESVVRSRM